MTEPMNPAEIAAKLLKACNGHPHAKIPWPHRILHDAAGTILALQAQLAAMTEARDAAVARVGVLEVALQSLMDLNDNYAPFGGELYRDRVDRTWDAARAALAPTTDKEPKT